MRGLWILYDDSCGFCRRCKAWLDVQQKLMPLRCLPASDPEVQEIFWGARRPQDEELVAVDSDGGVYRGPDAFLMALWTLANYRKWARILARPAMRPFARGVFELLSAQRRSLSVLFEAPEVPKCAGDSCSARL